MNPRSVLAIMAHPDDIEFMAAGTLLRLGELGWDIHYLNVSGGDLGSMTLGREEAQQLREKESRTAATLLGATYHPSIGQDMLIFYTEDMIRKLAAVIRLVKPRIVLTHSPNDYMEDHTNTSRLAVSAAFVRSMPNFITSPPVDPYPGDITIYHAMPHGLRDGMRQKITPDLHVDITSVRLKKRTALAAHLSQKSWLDSTQGMNSYLDSADAMARELGVMSGRWEYAEGWRRHLHLGLSTTDSDPLAEALGSLGYSVRA